MAHRDSRTSSDSELSILRGGGFSTHQGRRIRTGTGFTIVELLIVIVVIAILAAITIVSYNGISQRAKQSAAASSAESAAKKALSYAATNSDLLPPDLPTAGVSNDANTIFEYSYDNTAKTYCITATFQKVSYYVSNTNTTPTAGLCPGHTGGAPIADGVIIQTVTNSNCLATRIRAVDARDNHTYWVQKLADGKCWMLTNLAYAGGGTNTYNDVIPTGDGTLGTLNGPDNAGAQTYTAAKYYAPTGANPTTEPTPPSTSIGGTGQYGYLYNWCAAMGAANVSTSACANATTPTPDPSRSICPAGWRLPTTSEFAALNNTINGGSTSSDAGLIANPWLAQRGGVWGSSGFSAQASLAYYWSSSQYSSTSPYVLSFSSSSANPANFNGKSTGLTMRCLAN